MRGTILIFGQSKQERIKEVNEILKPQGFTTNKPHPDLHIISLETSKGKSIGIDDSRKIKDFLGQKPYQASTKAVVIQDAHHLTAQAQNALLKILEEPPTYATILLEASTKSALLETIISRAQLIRLTPNQQTQTTKPQDQKAAKKTARENEKWRKIKRLSEADKLNLAEKISKKERNQVITLLENWISNERTTLKKAQSQPDLQKAKQNLEILIQIRQDLKNTNVNLALALDLLLLHLS